MTQYDESRHLFDAAVYSTKRADNLVPDALREVPAVATVAVALYLCTAGLPVGGIAMDTDKDVCRPFVRIRADGYRTVVISTVVV